MLKPLLLSAIAVVAVAQITTVKVAIQTQGVFHSTNDYTSSTGIWFLPTNSFEILDPGGEEEITSTYNLGVFDGTPNNSNDQFQVALYQSVNGGPTAYVGNWTGHLNNGTVHFNHGVLRYCDHGRVYVWRLTQYEFALGEFMPVDATVTMERGKNRT